MAVMDIRFADETLDRLETDASFTAGYSPAVVKAFRKRVQQIRAAQDERLFYALKSLHYEKLKGKRGGEHSMRLNDQWRLIVALEGTAPNKRVLIKKIDDYH